MENYTKYKLKERDELVSLLADKDNLFVIACNKCFKEFETIDEPDCGEFEKLAAEQGKTITGSAKVDFLCNKNHTEQNLQDMIPEGTENVIVISCGLGIQTVADLAGKPVYAASNSLNYRGHHGMALTKKSCDACAQCYLNITGGICPIVDCSKSLVNGQCGGAKNGKCEVDGEKDCAWEKIYRRLEKQGRLEEFLNQPIQIRDYSKTNVKVIQDYVKSIREERLEGYYGGVHPSERKESGLLRTSLIFSVISSGTSSTKESETHQSLLIFSLTIGSSRPLTKMLTFWMLGINRITRSESNTLENRST